MLKSTLSIFVIVLLLFCTNPNESQAIPVDLSNWIADGPVVISNGGYTATFTEDPDISPVTLRTLLSIPTGAVSFSFDYELIVAADNDDYIDFYFEDLTIYQFTDGGYFSTTETTTLSGSHSVNLSSYINTNVNIIFGLDWDWDDWGFDSTLTINNVDMATTTSPIPEPGTLMLLGLGLAGLAGLGRRNRAKSS
jgi:hypothetical protein